jgi:hypothetical protein
MNDGNNNNPNKENNNNSILPMSDFKFDTLFDCEYSEGLFITGHIYVSRVVLSVFNIHMHWWWFQVTDLATTKGKNVFKITIDKEVFEKHKTKIAHRFFTISLLEYICSIKAKNQTEMQTLYKG